MKKNFLLILLPTILSASARAQTVLTSAVYNGHTYSLLSNSDWTDAEAKAISMGGHLATISDAAEDHWVFTTFSTFGGINRDLWIGLNDRNKKGTFVWASGQTSTYRNWSGGQPDDSNGNEDYVHIVSNAFPGGVQSKWNDLANSTSTAFSPLFGVVEVNAVPEPGQCLTLALGVFSVSRWTKRTKAARKRSGL